MASTGITPIRVKTTVFKKDQDPAKREPLGLQIGFLRYLRKIEGIEDAPPALPPRRNMSVRLSVRPKKRQEKRPAVPLKMGENKPKWNIFKMFKK
jgi:hypothetical protein